MITKKLWFGLVGAFGGSACLFISAVNGFVPKQEDLADPLGRPSALSLEVIHSSAEFDRLSGVLSPKHGNLSNRIQVLHTVAGDMGGLVDEAGKLVPAAGIVNSGTSSVRGVAKPLPPLINKVTGRAEQARPCVQDLGSSVRTVTTQLNGIGSSMRTVQGDLKTLGPRAHRISGVLGEVESESKRISPLSPVLQLPHELRRIGPPLRLSGLLPLPPASP